MSKQIPAFNPAFLDLMSSTHALRPKYGPQFCKGLRSASAFWPTYMQSSSTAPTGGSQDSQTQKQPVSQHLSDSNKMCEPKPAAGKNRGSHSCSCVLSNPSKNKVTSSWHPLFLSLIFERPPPKSPGGVLNTPRTKCKSCPKPPAAYLDLSTTSIAFTS